MWEKPDIDYDTASDMLFRAKMSEKPDYQGYLCLEIIQNHGMLQTTCDRLILDSWTSSEYPSDHDYVWDQLWEDYYLCSLKEQQDLIQSKILPNTKVYRGGDKNGRSWTMDIGVAKKFYDRKEYLENPEDGIWTRVINPEDVLAYLDDREEAEVVLKRVQADTVQPD